MSIRKKVDLQDVLLLCGVSALCGGIAAVYWPAALMTFGMLCLFAVYLIERSHDSKPDSPAPAPKQ